MTEMRARILIALSVCVANASAVEPAANAALDDKNRPARAIPSGQSATRLELSTRREGIVPYLPHASHVITINAPESALRQGWRCCWIEAYSLEDAKILSTKFTKSVHGNPPDIVFDATRTEASIRQIAPNIFRAYLAIGSTRNEGSHLARLYVHLYRNEETEIITEHGAKHARQRSDASDYASERKGNRVALNFLEESVLPIRFTYAPTGYNWGTANRPRDAVPSQLPNRTATQ